MEALVGGAVPYERGTPILVLTLQGSECEDRQSTNRGHVIRTTVYSLLAPSLQWGTRVHMTFLKKGYLAYKKQPPPRTLQQAYA